MYERSTTVFLATLGGQPQVITLALDLFFAQGNAINEVIVVHLSTMNPRYRAAAECLDREFANNTYQGRPCRYKRIPIRNKDDVMIRDLDNDTEIEAMLDAMHKLIESIKTQGSTIHLCLTGGRRLLGALFMSVAQLNFEYVDHAWHLYSSDEVRTLTKDGTVLHLPGHPDVRLLRVPILPGKHLPTFSLSTTEMGFNTTLDTQNKVADDSDYARCQQVWDELLPHQRKVLRAFADELTPQQVAERLDLSVRTVDAYKTTLFEHCRNVWDLPSDKKLNYHWLYKKFRTFF